MVEHKWLWAAGGQGSRLTSDQMESPVCITLLHPSSCVPWPAKTGAAGSSCPSTAPGLHTVNELNEEREGPYGFVWICTQASQSMCTCQCVCMCMFDLYAGQPALKQQQFN